MYMFVDQNYNVTFSYQTWISQRQLSDLSPLPCRWRWLRRAPARGAPGGYSSRQTSVQSRGTKDGGHRTGLRPTVRWKRKGKSVHHDDTLSRRVDAYHPTFACYTMSGEDRKINAIIQCVYSELGYTQKLFSVPKFAHGPDIRCPVLAVLHSNGHDRSSL